MKPSDFCIFPWESIFNKSENETVSLNIMKILKRTGNEFRTLTFDEYRTERLKDKDFTINESKYLDEVVSYCSSEEKCRIFSKEWRNL